MEFELVKTNIVNIHADAIVLPANTKLKEGSGASAAIFEAAGRHNLRKACEKIGTCEVGNATVTPAFDLDAKYIIHAVVSKWIDGKNREYELLCSAYLSSLQIADLMGCNSIAFPLLASGNNGYDLDLAFQIAKASIESFSGNNLKKVYLVLYGNRIATLVKEQGYDVTEIPEDLQKDKLKQERKARREKLAQERKEVVHDFVDESMQKGLEFFKDKKNREKFAEISVTIVKVAYEFVAASKKKN